MAAATREHTGSRPAPKESTLRIGNNVLGAAVIAMLAASVLCVAIAPTLMPDSYSIVEHSISESAAQRVEGVWLARAGLLLFGFAVLTLAGLAGRRWGPGGRTTHRIFGISLIGTATFAHMPWEDIPYDAFEDLLHSIASFAVGMSFIVGVVIVSIGRRRDVRRTRIVDWTAVAIAVAVPMIMFNVAGIAGVVQRFMFGVAYLWYGAEAIRSSREIPS